MEMIKAKYWSNSKKDNLLVLYQLDISTAENLQLRIVSPDNREGETSKFPTVG